MNIALNQFPSSERQALAKFLREVRERTGYTIRTSGSGSRRRRRYT